MCPMDQIPSLTHTPDPSSTLVLRYTLAIGFAQPTGVVRSGANLPLCPTPSVCQARLGFRHAVGVELGP